MWHIPLSVSELTIPHAADNYEKFEVFWYFSQSWTIKKITTGGKRLPILFSTIEYETKSFDGDTDEDVVDDLNGRDYLRMEDGDVIDPDEFVAWLVTQPNANGTLYLERVARHYVSFLRNTPQRLDTTLSTDERNIFACETVDEIERLWAILATAPNYKEINERGHNSFSAGLRCYARYLAHKDTSDIERIKVDMSIMEAAAYSYKPTINLTSDERIAIEMVLETRYTNGFRLDSIELGRLRRFVLEHFEIDLKLTDDELTMAVKTCGTLFEGKLYMVSKETKLKIKRVAEDYFASRAKVIFYEEFYAKNEYWLFDASVVSAEMLIGLLRHLFPMLEFTETYFGYASSNINSVLVSEILRIWGDDILLSYRQISGRLQYIPVDRIKFALGQNADFLWNSTEVFTHKSKIDTTESECTAIRQTVAQECSKHRYVSVADLPLGEFAERNYELSQTAIHNAAYSIYLADNYNKRGKIITPKGELIDALTIMREHCRSLDRITLDELLGFEKNLTGECHRWLPMQAGYDVMVRIDENTYIAECHVDFDTENIDNAIEHFIHGEYTPLRTVTTFAVFPNCGQVWNLFLLESYVRRFSIKFRFESPSVNNKNAGCIVRKHSKLSYDDIMIDAISKSNLTLHDENMVADFLFNKGYRGSRQKAKLADLIKQAKRLRERGN